MYVLTISRVPRQLGYFSRSLLTSVKELTVPCSLPLSGDSFFPGALGGIWRYTYILALQR